MSHVTTIEFLQALYPDPVRPGQLMVWTWSRKNGKRRSHWLHTLGEAATEAHRQRASREAYFSVPLHDCKKAVALTRKRWPRVQKPSARGCEDSAVALPALWAEIQVAGSADDRALPPDRDAVYPLFEAVLVPPSIVVDAGGAYQAYWLLRDLLILETAGDRARARDLLGRLQGALHAAAQVMGWSVGHDADLARRMRLPDTFNLGGPDPTWINVEHFPRVKTAGAGPAGDHRYRTEDFSGLPEPPEEPARELLLRGARAKRASSRPRDLEPILDGCPWLEYWIRNARRLQGRKYLAVVRVLCRCTFGGLGGGGLVRRLSEQHPGYRLLKTEENLALALEDDPPTCRWIAGPLGGREKHCRPCAHFGHIEGPIDLGRPVTAAVAESAGGGPAERGPAERGPAERGPAAGSPASIVVGDVEQAVHHDLVFGLAELLDDLGGAATVKQILQRLTTAPGGFPLLRRALAELVPGAAGRAKGAPDIDGLPSSFQLAGRLRSYRGRVVRGARIDQASKHHAGTRWTVRRVVAATEVGDV